MIKFILKLIINLLLFSSYILSAQNNDEDSVYILEYNQELNEIKKDKKLYFFSEIHIDNLSFIFKESSLVDEKEKSAAVKVEIKREREREKKQENRYII